MALAAVLIGGLLLLLRGAENGGSEATVPVLPWPASLVDALSAPAARAPVQAPPAPDAQGPEERQICGGAWKGRRRRTVEGEPPQNQAEVATASVVTGALGASLVSALPNYQALVNACKATALADVNRRQSCTEVADLLSTRSDALLSRSIGARLWEATTGSGDRRERLRAESLAWGLSDADAVDPVASLGCPALRRTLDRLRQEAVLGEAGAMRAWVARSGLTAEDILDRSRAFDAGAAAAGAQAASAAAAASAPP